MKLWKRKRKVDVSSIIQVPLAVLIREVIYDTMLTPTEEIAVAMGLPPISDEVAQMEEEASQMRLQSFSPLLPFIDTHADIVAKIATSAYTLEELNTVSFAEQKDFDELTKLFRLVALSSSLSCVSTLFSLGLIESRVGNDGR